MQGALKTNAVVALFFPLMILAVPILDTGFVVAKRLKYGRPIYKADRWHFHHRMANIGFSQRRTLALPLRLDRWCWRCWRWPCASSPTATTTATSTPLWTAVMAAFGLLAAGRQRLPGPGAGDPQAAPDPPPPAGHPAPPGRAPPSRSLQEVNVAVEQELETGTFPTVDPETGEFEAID